MYKLKPSTKKSAFFSVQTPKFNFHDLKKRSFFFLKREQPIVLNYVQIILKDTLKQIGDQHKETLELTLNKIDAQTKEKEAQIEKLNKEKEAQIEKLNKEKEAQIEKLNKEKEAQIEKLNKEKEAQIEKLNKEKEAEKIDIIIKYEQLKSEKRVIEQAHSKAMLKARAEQNIRGALEYARYYFHTTGKTDLSWTEPVDHILSKMQHNADFNEKLKQKCDELKNDLKNVKIALRGLYHRASLPHHGLEFDKVVIDCEWWKPHEQVALRAIFEYCKIEYFILDDTGLRKVELNPNS